MFSRYFDFFAFTLHRTTPTPVRSIFSQSQLGLTVPNSKPTAQKAVVKAPLRPRNAHDLELRTNAIEALPSLISANVDPAYHQFAEMGSTGDLSARSAYLESKAAPSFLGTDLAAHSPTSIALVKVIEKGTTFDRLVRPAENDTFAQLLAVRPPQSRVCSTSTDYVHVPARPAT